MSDKGRPNSREVTVQQMLEELTSLFHALDIRQVEADEKLSAYEVLDLPSVQAYPFEQIAKVGEFLECLKETNFPGGVLQYSLITQRIFEQHRTDGVESLSEKIRDIAQDHFSDMLKDAELSRRFYKLIDHLQLATFQLNEILEQTKEKQDELLKSLQEANKTIEKSEKEINSLKEETRKEISKLYVQFVTILGIFTAIVVSVFGGLSILGGLFERVDATPAWKIILVGSSVSIFVLCTLFLLTKWISNIVYKTFGYGQEHSLIDNVLSNGGFATGIFIFGYLMIASVILSSDKASSELNHLLNVGDSLPILFLLGVPVVIGFAVFIKALDVRKS